jgi:dTDP-4-amino-4,6-dideoxygalactose transaminase
MNIPLVDLAAQFKSIEAEVLERIESVVRSQRFILGPEVEEAEKKIAALCGAPIGVGVASGTDALILSLRALGIGPGDEVITTPFTFYATAGSVVHAGAMPVFVDIEPDTCLISAEAVEAAVTARTRAIIPVHLFGQCADMGRIMEIAGRLGLAVIEDACQAIGAEFEGKRAGSIGDAGALSFYPSKNLGGYGDGGMVVTRREDVAANLRVLRVHGARSEYRHEVIGYNSRLDTIQAAVLLAKLPHLEKWGGARAKNAAIYDRRFAGSSVIPLARRRGRKHVYNNYVVRAPRRDELMAALKAQDIGCAVYYPEPLSKMACFERFVGGAFPASEEAARTCLAIPAYPEMTPDMVEQVADAVLDFYGERK